MRTKFFVLILIMLATYFGHAQKAECPSIVDWNKLISNPSLLKAFLSKEAAKKEAIDALGIEQQTSQQALVNIPVVFHIVLSDPNVITDQIIKSTIDSLNLHFQTNNKDTANGPLWDSDRGRTNFNFVLAKYSPDGCETNGITRTVSPNTFSFLDNDAVAFSATGGIEKWETPFAKYLNIWVCDLIGSLRGYAYWPDGEGKSEAVQGVVVDYKTLPWPGGDPDINLGKTLIHEVGHYFDLRHIWGDATGCNTDDFISDTPIQDDATSNSLCPAGIFEDACQPFGSNGIMYQNHMDYTGHACRTMFTVKQCKRMMLALNTAPNRKGLISPNNRAFVRPSIETFTACNAPAFTGNVFKTINVGRYGVVWAGTANQGLYQYNKNTWRKWDVPPYQTVNYQDIKPDQDGRMWVAQSGINGSQSTYGATINFLDTTLTNYQVYTPIGSSQPTRNVRNLFIDTSRYKDEVARLPYTWSAHYATTSPSASGSVGLGVNGTGAAFTKITYYIDSTNNGGGVFYIAGDTVEIWAYASNNYGKSQILRYSAQNGGVLNRTPYDATNVLAGLLPLNFTARSIYADALGNRWITVNGEGLVVRSNTLVWSKVNFTDLFTANPAFSPNALAGDAFGNVFIGTTNGLVIYNGGYALNSLGSYKRYTTAEGLPSNNVLGVSIDTLTNRLLIATDNGIAFWTPSCTGANLSKAYYTTSPGNIGSASTWCLGAVPNAHSDIIVKHPITITSNISVRSTTIIAPGSITISPGVNFNILGQ